MSLKLKVREMVKFVMTGNNPSHVVEYLEDYTLWNMLESSNLLPFQKRKGVDLDLLDKVCESYTCIDEQAFSGEKGSGERFDACVKKILDNPKFKPRAGQSPEGAAKAICAAIGRKKFGKSAFQKMAVAGK